MLFRSGIAMGGSSVPSSTASFQQLATGIWGSPEAAALAKPILKPAMQNIKEQQDMLMGFQKGDPTQTRKFFGLPTDAPPEEMAQSIASKTRGPEIAMPTKTAAQGGLMSLDDSEDPRKRYAKGKATTVSAPKKAGLSDDAANFLQDKLIKGGKISPARQKQLDAYITANPNSNAAQAQTQSKKDTTAVQTAARQEIGRAHV